jgi:hypothetical protein
LGQESCSSVFLFWWFSDMQKITYPTKTLSEGCEYTSAAGTNVQLTWRRFGWRPLAELQTQQQPKQTVKQAQVSEEVCHA